MSESVTQNVEAVRVLSMKPGDVVVVEMNGNITRDQAQGVQDHFAKVFPNNKVLVLCGGKVAVMREVIP